MLMFLNTKYPFKADNMSISSEMSVNGISGSSLSLVDADRRGSTTSTGIQSPQIRPVRPAPRLPAFSDQQHRSSNVRRSAPPIPPRCVSLHSIIPVSVISFVICSDFQLRRSSPYTVLVVLVYQIKAQPVAGTAGKAQEPNR